MTQAILMAGAPVLAFAVSLTTPLRRLVARLVAQLQTLNLETSAPLFAPIGETAKLNELIPLYNLINHMLQARTMSDQANRLAERWLFTAEMSTDREDLEALARQLMRLALNEQQRLQLPWDLLVRATNWCVQNGATVRAS